MTKLQPHSNSVSSDEGRDRNFRVDREGASGGQWGIDTHSVNSMFYPAGLLSSSVIYAFPLTTWLITMFICRS